MAKAKGGRRRREATGRRLEAEVGRAAARLRSWGASVSVSGLWGTDTAVQVLADFGKATVSYTLHADGSAKAFSLLPKGGGSVRRARSLEAAVLRAKAITQGLERRARAKEGGHVS